MVAINEEESKNLATLIEKKAKIIDQIFVGQRVFAYPIKKNESGFYTNLLISTEIDNYNLIKKELDDTDVCLRYLTFSSKRSNLKKDKDRERTQRPVPIKKISKKIEKTDKIEEEPKKEIKKVKKATKIPKPKKVNKNTKKVKISELDEKLKKLLEE